MSQRERLASRGSSEEAPRPSVYQESTLRAQGASGPGNLQPVDCWEKIYRTASPVERRELLTLAQSQGLLYGHQLPNGNKDAKAIVPEPLIPGNLLNGYLQNLEPVLPEPVEVYDSGLDIGQREAVTRAVRTPDFCLIQGLPGTGKSRIAAEIITQAASLGQRVLLLGFSTASIDRVLGLIQGREIICPVRCVGGEESLESLPPWSAPLTVAERVRQLSEIPLAKARQQLADLEQRSARLQLDEAVLDRLDELAREYQELEDQVKLFNQQASRLSTEVEEEAAAAERDESSPGSPFSAAVQAAAKTHKQALAALEKSITELQTQKVNRRREQDDLMPRLDSDRTLADAKEHGRWWTSAWWKATFHTGAVAELRSLETQCQKIQVEIERMEEVLRELMEERDQETRTYQSQSANRTSAEIARRQACIANSREALHHDVRLIQEKWHLTCRELDTESGTPKEIGATAVQVVRDVCRRRFAEFQEQKAFAQELVASLEEQASSVKERLIAYVNLVAATTAALPVDDFFGDRCQAAQPFDLMILQEADQVTDSEFHHLGSRACRWVLIGEPANEREIPGGQTTRPSPSSDGKSSRKTRHPANSRTLAQGLRPAFFQRLWQHLHCDPRRLPYSWDRKANHLCCRLRQVDPEHRNWIESERVADSPEIELRILAIPRTKPVLVEVVFPLAMSIHQAKEYLYRELEELPIQATNQSLAWREELDQIVCQFSDAAPDSLPISLTPGVCERLGSFSKGTNGCPNPETTMYTSRLEFNRSAGWDRVRAEKWTHKHLGIQDLGRTFYLDVPYRMNPGLASFVSDLLFDGAYRTPGIFLSKVPEGQTLVKRENCSPCRKGCSSDVHFVAVPPTPAIVDGSRPRMSKGGAGFECDLSDVRHSDRLPNEYRSGLPDQGFVNFLEAQAVVRTLESLVAELNDHEVQEQEVVHRDDIPAIGVLALYPAQVELIRSLIKQSSCLANCGSLVEVDVPGAFREREWPVTLLSLTRSHGHRAVTFGEGPQSLTLALTRARTKLILFGDPGTLARRCQWEGPLDHLDGIAAAREREVLTHLVRYLQGQGFHQQTFHLSEGSGV